MSDQGYWHRYEHISWARHYLGLPHGCDDNDITRAMLRLFQLPAPVSVLGDTGMWFRQLAIEAAVPPQGSRATWARCAAREAMTVLPERRAEILRLLHVSKESQLEERLATLLERADRNRPLKVQVLDGSSYRSREVEILTADLEVDNIPDDPDPLSQY
jgi:hypothetical protein